MAVNLAIETKDWSELVDIVLRGEADLLLGKLSEDKEVQEFINNANIFKTKVQKIHDGNILKEKYFIFIDLPVFCSCKIWITESSSRTS